MAFGEDLVMGYDSGEEWDKEYLLDSLAASY